ncbi:MAG: hypothetical protein P4L34_13275 [Paludibacter sp.]|nr:hypothetical protein [Paludibacter sp.]
MAILLVMATCGLWMMVFISERFSDFSNQDSTLLQGIQSVISPNSLLANLISISFTLLNAFLLAQINNRFTIIRSRTFLPILIFLILMSTWNRTHIAYGSQIALTLIILALFYFFSMSRDKKASEQAFMGSFLISICSIFFNPFIFIIPISWIGFMMFQSFSLRTFLASILGTLAPWVLYLSTRYLISPDFIFANAFKLTIPNYSFSFSLFTLPEIIYTVSIIIIITISIFGLLSLTQGDAIHTRNKLNFLIFLLISLSILTVIFWNQFVSFLPIIALVYSMIISHPLTLKHNNFYGILFIIFCIINIGFLISTYFIF